VVLVEVLLEVPVPRTARTVIPLRRPCPAESMTTPGTTGCARKLSPLRAGVVLLSSTGRV
jgi:hypothetical protein